jgi:hypothetical protein
MIATGYTNYCTISTLFDLTFPHQAIITFVVHMTAIVFTTVVSR